VGKLSDLRRLPDLLGFKVLLGPVEETTRAHLVEVCPDESHHRDTQPYRKDHTLMIHKISPGSFWLAQLCVRPPKRMISGAAVAHITKIDELAEIAGLVIRAALLGFELVTPGPPIQLTENSLTCSPPPADDRNVTQVTFHGFLWESSSSLESGRDPTAYMTAAQQTAGTASQVAAATAAAAARAAATTAATAASAAAEVARVAAAAAEATRLLALADAYAVAHPGG